VKLNACHARANSDLYKKETPEFTHLNCKNINLQIKETYNMFLNLKNMKRTYKISVFHYRFTTPN